MSERSPRSETAANVLCFFLGWAGAHRFYLGHYGLGVLQLLSFGGCTIWWLVDLILLAMGHLTDAEGRELS